MSVLNASQQVAVKAIKHHNIVIACPGSGKTKVIEEKVRYILQVDENAIIQCVTFTKAGADEMRNRIFQIIPDRQKKQVKVNTFHSIAYGMRDKTDEKMSMEMITDFEKQTIYKRIFKDLVFNKPVEFDDFYSEISNYLVHRNPQELDENYHIARECYKKFLGEHEKSDFDELLVKMNDRMSKGEVNLSDAKYILCDEAQDSDLLMQHWLEMHANSNRLITILLDDDQTLYSYKHSLGVDIANWLASEMGGEILKLEDNYRSHTEILLPAQMLIANNDHRQSKHLKSARGKGGVFRCGLFTYLEEAIEYIGDWARLYPHESIAIITRTNADGDLFAEKIQEKMGESFESSSNKSPLKSNEVSAVVSFLIGIENLDPTAVFAAYEIVLGLDDGDVDMLGQSVFDGCYSSPLDVLKSIFEEEKTGYVNLGGVEGTRVKDTVKIIIGFLAVRNDKKALIKKMEEYLDSFGARHQIKDRSLNLVFSFLEVMERFGDNRSENQEGNRHGKEKSFSDTVKEYERWLKEQKNDGQYQVLTAHKSKGMAFDHVFIMPVCDGKFPGKAVSDEQNGIGSDMSFKQYKGLLEEERRILYVAITRARLSCHVLSYAITAPAEPGATRRSPERRPSPFFGEMGCMWAGLDVATKMVEYGSVVKELVIEEGSDEDFHYRKIR